MEHGDLTGALLEGRYRVLEPVAQGAMGTVYRAERVKLGRIVAVKVLHEVLPQELAGRQRFEIEARAMARLEHPHCASVLDFGVPNDRPFVVMDFVSGQNLRDVIASGPQPIPRAVEIVRQVLTGLAHAHELGIIHRDIKPANLVLSQKTGLGDHVKILDFGLARLHDAGQNLTTGIVVGTPAYMAPEQIRGHALDARADLYACGVLLFELLTGDKPFHSEADDPIEVCRMHLSAPVPRLSDKLPDVDFGDLEAVVAKALAKDRDGRYASAQEFAAALEAAAGRPSRQTLPPAPPAPHRRCDLGDPGAAAGRCPGSHDDPARRAAGHAARRVAARHAAGRIARGHAAGRIAHGHAAGRRREQSRPARSARPAGHVPRALGARADAGAARLRIGVRAARSVGARAGGEGLGVARGRGAGSAAAAALGDRDRRRRGGRGRRDRRGGRAPRPHGRSRRVRSLRRERIGEKEAALDVLRRARRQYPDSALLAYTAGRICFSKYYWTEGLKDFRDAIRSDPGYRSDPELIKIVLRGFITTPGYNDDLAGFLRDDIGSAAQPFLDETARDHPNPVIRSRAAAELRRYR
ncbi:MAG: serine/threonine protein kinase [Deltaproteobacteria bacterium]|nr:MAG: serine/threonine protein kinase [Deltaproteobacteria bacterium]